MGARAQSKSDKEQENTRHGGWWWRILLGVVLLLVLGVVVFHQVFLQEGAKRAIDQFAEGQDLDLEYSMEKTDLLDKLVLTDVRLERGEDSRFPLETLIADRIVLDYDLGQGARRNWAAVLEALTMKNATAIVRPVGEKPAEEPEPDGKTGPAETVTNIFRKMKKFEVPVIDLNNVTVEIYDREGDKVFGLREAYLTVKEDQEGPLRISELKLPTGAVLENVRAEVLYENFHLRLRDLVISEQVGFERILLNFEEIREEKLGVEARGRAFDAEITTDMLVMRQEGDLALEGTVNVQDIVLEKVQDLLEIDDFPSGHVELLDLYVQGDPMKPEDLFARLELRAEDLEEMGVTLHNLVFRGKLEGGTLTIQEAEATTNESSLEAVGWARLNADKWAFDRSEAHLFLDMETPEIAQILDPDRYKARGAVDLDARVQLEGGRLVSSAGVMELEDFSYDGYRVQAAEAELAARQNVVYAERVLINLTPENSLSVNGWVSLDEPHSFAMQTRADFNELAAIRPEVLPEDFAMDIPLPDSGTLAIALEATGDLTKPETYEADAQLQTENLRITLNEDQGTWAIQRASLEGGIADGTVTVGQVQILLTPENGLRFSGQAGMEKPYPYEIEAQLDLEEIAALRREVVPERMNLPLPAAGVLQLALQGQGKVLEPETHEIALRLQGENLQPVQPEEGAEGLSGLSGRDDYHLAAQAQLEDQVLTIPALRLGLGEEELLYLKGEAPVRLPPKEEGTAWIPEGGEITGSLRVVKTPIAVLAGLMGAEAPVTGTIEAEGEVSGTLDDPKIRLILAGHEIALKDNDSFEPAEVLVRAVHDGEQLQLSGSIDQPQVEPLQVQLKSPVTLEHFTDKDKDLAEVPLTAQLALPQTSLEFLKEFFPDLVLEDSRAAAEIAISGTFGEPVLEGELAAAAARVGMAESDIPALEALRLSLNFNGQTVDVQTLSAAVSGGRFEITGSIDLGKHILGWAPGEAQPAAGQVAEADADADAAETEAGEVEELPEMTLDLQVDGQDLLLYRNDKILLRSNADLAVKGPLKSVAVTGQMALTTGRYYQEFNLLPLRLPGGQRVSRPPAPGGRNGLSMAGTPFEEWTIDVKVTTENPFLLQGNVAQGRLVAGDNLALRGTGAGLTLVGNAVVENFKLILPFSTVQANSGTLTFRPDEMFNPELNVTGRTRVEGRDITVYAYGRVLDPQTSFSSSPPMTQEQIVTLLATGTTPAQFTGDEGAGAQRALMFAAKEVYRKVFGGDPALNQDLLGGAVSLESEGVNPATGEERTTATMNLSRDVKLRTSVETDGTFRGVLQYMIRLDN